MATNETAHGEHKISVTRTIEAPNKDIFEVLSLPSRHAEFDGSGMVVSDDHNDRIEKSGVKFTMNMNAEHMGGEYQTDNFVVAFDQNRLIGWKTAPAGTEPKGWQWIYTLEPVDQDTTEVTLTYDWSQVEDPELLKKNIFPLVSEEQLEDSLAKLAGLF